MLTNQTPAYDATDNPTGCCPRFRPEGWDRQELHFEDKPFVRASTVSFLHVPLNMGAVFARTSTAIQKAHADGAYLVMTSDDSPWHAEHLFAVTGEVPGAEVVYLTGDYFTRVFEGPYGDVPRWCEGMEAAAAEQGRGLERLYFFYTTCPRCAKAYGNNYVVGIGKLGTVEAK